MTVDANAGLVRRYIEAIWNQWNYGLVDEILAETIVFRGSLGDEVRGRDAFREYMHKVSRAFPDFHNRIAEMVVEGDRVATRLAYSGTHSGELFGLAPTGRRVEYAGTGFYRIHGGKIVEGWCSAIWLPFYASLVRTVCRSEYPRLSPGGDSRPGDPSSWNPTISSGPTPGLVASCRFAGTAISAQTAGSEANARSIR